MRLNNVRRWNSRTFFQPVDILSVDPPQHPAFTQQSQEAMGRGWLWTALAILAGIQVASEPIKRPRIMKELLEIKQIFGTRKPERCGIESLVQAGFGSKIGYSAADGNAGTGQDDNVLASAKDVTYGGEAC